MTKFVDSYMPSGWANEIASGRQLRVGTVQESAVLELEEYLNPDDAIDNTGINPSEVETPDAAESSENNDTSTKKNEYKELRFYALLLVGIALFFAVLIPLLFTFFK